MKEINCILVQLHTWWVWSPLTRGSIRRDAFQSLSFLQLHRTLLGAPGLTTGSILATSILHCFLALPRVCPLCALQEVGIWDLQIPHNQKSKGSLATLLGAGTFYNSCLRVLGLFRIPNIKGWHQANIRLSELGHEKVLSSRHTSAECSARVLCPASFSQSTPLYQWSLSSDSHPHS